jgi:hypothetical protein
MMSGEMVPLKLLLPRLLYSVNRNLADLRSAQLNVMFVITKKMSHTLLPMLVILSFSLVSDISALESIGPVELGAGTRRR